MSRRRGPSLYWRPGFGWVTVPLPFGFRLGHRLARHHGLWLPGGFRLRHRRLTRRGGRR